MTLGRAYAEREEEYVYWSSGALMSDYNKKICQFKYNYLLLPQSVQFRYGHRIEYTYDASGMKRTAKYREANHDMNYGPCDNREPAESDFLSSALTKNYIGNKVYENGNLKLILTDNGYIEKSGTTYSRYYYLKDHLGNTRLVLNSSGMPVQITNYYPSGTTMAESPARTDQGIQPYKYNGKELDRSKGLDFYDYEARQYDPVLMRFTAPDPLAEKYYAVSPYAYCLNNPVKFVDPSGKDVVIVGIGAQRIADELNKISKLNITYEPTNQYLSYTKEKGVEYSQLDRELMTAIDDKGVTVKLNGVSVEQSYNHETNDKEKKGSIVFGAFEGSEIRGSGDNTKVFATQSIDITSTVNAEKAGIDRAGNVVAHELLEGYYGARDFPGAKSTDQKAYMSSHLKSLNVLPLKLSMLELNNKGEIKVSINGLSPIIVRPAKK